jgi:Mitochondrial carrier protein
MMFLVLSSVDYTGFNNPGLFCQFVFGGVSGVFGHVVSYPFDVVRRRMQTAGKHLASPDTLQC